MILDKLFRRNSVDEVCTLVEAFLLNTVKYPNEVAVVDDEGVYTYLELNQISNSVAAKLAKLSIGNGDIVPIYLPRGKGFVAAFLGVMKSGAAFVPLDENYPLERIHIICDSVKAKLIINEEWMHDLPQQFGEINKARLNGIAMIIFTSGSSGYPKGVIHTNKSILAIARSSALASNIYRGKRYANVLSTSFNGGMTDFFSCIYVGTSIYVASEAVRKDIPMLIERLSAFKVNGLRCLPSIAKILIIDGIRLADLEWIELLGEKVSSINNDSKIKLINHYGNSECSMCTYFVINDSFVAPPIGIPVPGIKAYILDECGIAVPSGDVGELCFAGQQVAKGYWQLPELTAEKFVPCPFLPGDVTMYKTGDLARYREDGNIELVGRIDFQIKIRGYRIEPEEIENVALRFDGIDAVVVVAKEIGEEKHIVLYYTSGIEIEDDQLKEHLSRFLADYMVPKFYVRLDEMPRNANGKIDRNRLPEPKLDYYGNDPDKPTTGLEQIIFDAVAKQIGSSDFGINDDLIDLGLTSLSSMILSVDLVSRGVKLSSMEGLSFYNELVRVRSVKGLAQSLSVEK